MINNFPFHNVEKRPWPIFLSFRLLGALLNSVFYFHSFVSFFFPLFFFFFVILKTWMWWDNVIIERNFGFHNNFLVKNFFIGMILMIISEVFFFSRFFWRFFHNCWFPRKEIGSIWPPKGLNPILVDSFSIPFLKTIILLSSGVTVTFAHHSLQKKKNKQFIFGLQRTIFLGLLFLFLQNFEYIKSLFSFKTMVYGSCFYMLTGFHGAHVIVGTIFLFICYFRTKKVQNIPSHHVGFTLAIWYWHFVDVVWLFLFLFVYWYTTLCYTFNLKKNLLFTPIICLFWQSIKKKNFVYI